jgi:hypothetical protein
MNRPHPCIALYGHPVERKPDKVPTENLAGYWRYRIGDWRVTSEIEASPMDRAVLGERFRSIEGTSDDDLAAYGVSNDMIAEMRSMFQHWADIITCES